MTDGDSLASQLHPPPCDGATSAAPETLHHRSPRRRSGAIYANQCPDGYWRATGPGGATWRCRRLEDVVRAIRRCYPEAMVRATASAAMARVVVATLHCVRWLEGPGQPSWLRTEGVAPGDAVDAVVSGLEHLPGGGPGAEDLVVEELACTFTSSPQVLQVRWPDGHTEDLVPGEDLCGGPVAEAIRDWAAHPWRAVEECEATARFLAAASTA